MNRLPSLLRPLKHRFAAARRIAAVLTLTLLATGCGPGTGGSGIGPIAGAYTTSDVLTFTGTTASSTGPSDVVLAFDDTLIRAEGACWAFSYQGTWVESAGEVRVTGFYRAADARTDLASASATPATLVARVEAAGLFVTLFDAKGATIATFAPATAVPEGVTPKPPPTCITIAPMGARLPG